MRPSRATGSHCSSAPLAPTLLPVAGGSEKHFRLRASARVLRVLVAIAYAIALLSSGRFGLRSSLGLQLRQRVRAYEFPFALLTQSFACVKRLNDLHFLSVLSAPICCFGAAAAADELPRDFRCAAAKLTKSLTHRARALKLATRTGKRRTTPQPNTEMQRHRTRPKVQN